MRFEASQAKIQFDFPPYSGGTRHMGLDGVICVLLWCFVFTVPFEREFMIPGFGTISRLVAALLLPCACLALVSRGWLRHLHPIHWCMTALVAWGALSYFWSVSQSETQIAAFTELQNLIVVILIWQFFTTKTGAIHLTEAYVCGTLVSCGSTLVRFLSNQHTEWGRFAAEGFDPNDLSLTLAISIPLSYCLFLRSKGWRSAFWLVQIAVALLTCFLTASRTGMIAAALGLSIIVVTAKRLTGKQLLAFLLLASAAAAVVTALVPLSSWNRLFTISSEVSEGTMNGRTALWSGGLQAFAGHPVAGVGAGAFPEGTFPYIYLPAAGHEFVAHNTYISVLTELGVIGFLLLLAIIGTTFRSIAALPLLERRVWLVAFLVWTIGVSTLTWEKRKPTWILLCLILQSSGGTVLLRRERELTVRSYEAILPRSSHMDSQPTVQIETV